MLKYISMEKNRNEVSSIITITLLTTVREVDSRN